jgi:hypothetical protein
MQGQKQKRIENNIEMNLNILNKVREIYESLGKFSLYVEAAFTSLFLPRPLILLLPLPLPAAVAIRKCLRLGSLSAARTRPPLPAAAGGGRCT